MPEVERRNFLNTLIGIGFLTTIVGFFVPIVAYLKPLKNKNLPSNLLKGKNGILILPKNLKEGNSSLGRFEDQIVLVIRKGGKILGFEAVCTHLGCIVKWNDKVSLIECPCHGGKFNLQGKVVSGPPPNSLKTLRLRAEGNRILRG